MLCYFTVRTADDFVRTDQNQFNKYQIYLPDFSGFSLTVPHKETTDQNLNKGFAKCNVDHNYCGL